VRKIFGFLKTIFYYLKSSYKIWKVERLKKDEVIYTTQKNVQIIVYPGRENRISL
jgi:molybdopterin synthase catalytic subunit